MSDSAGRPHGDPYNDGAVCLCNQTDNASVAPAAHSGHPYKVALWRLLNNHVAKPVA